MAVKFPLEMQDGVQVRNIAELKDNFNIEKVVGYFLDGRLKKWLDARWYEKESDEISKLDANDPLLAEHLCNIFGVAYVENEINKEEISLRNERVIKLKQYTNDENILANIDKVAFNQDEMADLLNKDISVIYLCGEMFEIPLMHKNVHYIGVNSPVAIISAQQEVDFGELGIIFDGIEFDERYKQIMILPYKKVVELHRDKQYEKSKPWFEKYAHSGNAEAMWYLGLYYKNGYGTEMNLQKSYEWYLKGAEAGDFDAMNSVGLCYENGKGIPKDSKKAAEWYKKGACAGAMYAMYNWARCCEDGIGVFDSSEREPEKYLSWYEKSADLGHAGSMGRLATYYRNSDYNKALYWAKKGEERDNEKSVEILVSIYNRMEEYEKVFELLEARAQKGDIRAMITLYDWYSTGRVVLKSYRNYSKAFQWLTKAAEAGDLNSINELGNVYNNGRWGIAESYADAKKWWAKADYATGMWNSYYG